MQQREGMAVSYGGGQEDLSKEVTFEQSLKGGKMWRPKILGRGTSKSKDAEKGPQFATWKN